ncbi:hypothetical protein RHMOL_Rhmol07G0219100 [Rhododendron molle]|uniref:Uncharacterized protein n=1 Tax=Rhododendron molle TaxID=49168 RepID=A0ACC0N502_RHOML|nr:hypothetical protein RHMOL_Rhmol07G0219100 [Rhododendron molle]
MLLDHRETFVIIIWEVNMSPKFPNAGHQNRPRDARVGSNKNPTEANKSQAAPQKGISKNQEINTKSSAPPPSKDKGTASSSGHKFEYNPLLKKAAPNPTDVVMQDKGGNAGNQNSPRSVNKIVGTLIFNLFNQMPHLDQTPHKSRTLRLINPTLFLPT